MRTFLHKLYDSLSRHLPSNGLRIACQRARGVKIGQGVFLGYEVIIDQTYPELIEIEDYARISPGVMIFAHARPGDFWMEAMGEQRALVKIKTHAAIYAGAIVMPGVTVGEYAIVRAGAVVEEDVPPRTVVAGVPARIVDTLPPIHTQEQVRTGEHNPQ
jgi:acetyltransferase-like isoleucine patch superfamily enzyme